MLILIVENSMFCFFLTTDEGLPGDINVTDVTTSSISVSWTMSDVPMTNYQVQIEQVAGGSPLHTGTVNANGPYVYEFQNLSPGVEYRINVFFTGTNPVVVRRVKQRTSKLLVANSCERKYQQSRLFFVRL